MTLRRLTRHVRTRNWFAVGVDLLIVVIGAFTGIRVPNWDEARRALARTDLHAERVSADLRIELEYAEGLVADWATHAT